MRRRRLSITFRGWGIASLENDFLATFDGFPCLWEKREQAEIGVDLEDGERFVYVEFTVREAKRRPTTRATRVTPPRRGEKHALRGGTDDTKEV